MYKLTKNQENSAVVGYAIIWALIGFVSLFFMSQAILTAVYGEIPPAYYQTVLITENASNQTEGVMIDKYVLFIKGEVCPTLNSTVAEKECRNL